MPDRYGDLLSGCPIQGVVAIGNTGAIAAPQGMFPGSRPVRRGETILVYCTGLGSLCRHYQHNCDSDNRRRRRFSFVLRPCSHPGGRLQVNIVVPADAPVSDAAPLVLSIGGVDSNKVTIAVQ